MDGRLLGGRYRLLEAHAMGGMASVWRAHDERTGEVVAVKRLHPHLTADEGARERFRREATAMESIRHPNVVAVRDAVVDTDEPALVMDFVAGRSIAELAADAHVFDEPEALRVAAAVADGLAAVHERGIVHRDLKPGNVLVGDDGGVRLSDFGIAVGLMDATALTADDGVIGTLRYLAPERLAGEPATPATDVWGLGTVLYEMLTGVAAFPETTLAARVEAAAVPVARPEGLSDATWAVLARALANDPHDRYADGAAMATELHRLPGVPAAAVIAPDPFAPTEIVALPVAAAAAAAPIVAERPMPSPAPPAPIPERAAPAPIEPAIEPRPVLTGPTTVPSKPSRSALAMAGIVGVLTLALVVGMATANPTGNGPEPAAAAGSASPAPKATPTPKPKATATPAPAQPPKNENGKENGKGKGKGKGGD
ncbi:MAG TPA: serine/threonine-protein kinase [Methylomirabilota bacterium]|nr:serine/threonine-protein kinase [Methylomirabilota bacterium]